MKPVLPRDIMLIDKPKGITSFDVIRRLRRKLGFKKMGHAGTLDPQATGLLIVGIGEGTKKLSEFLKLSKVYVAEILLGVQTDTGDLEGRVIAERTVPKLERAHVEAVLTAMRGERNLPVPLYSAVKRGGKPLYAYARKGEKIRPPEKTMKIIHAQLLHMKEGELAVQFEVASGTYIRSIAEELGRRLKTVATLQNLRRTKVGDFRVEDAEHIP